MTIIADDVVWGSDAKQHLTFSYDSRRSGIDMQYKLQITVAPFYGGEHYFGFPIYATIRLAGKTAVSGVEIKAADPPTWTSELTYETEWLTVPNKQIGSVSVAFNIFSGLGSDRNETYSYSLPVITAASTITVPHGTLGTLQTIKSTRYGPFKEVVHVSCGPYEKKLYITESQTETQWTPPLTYAYTQPSRKSLEISFYVETYTSGNELVGTYSTSQIYDIPDLPPSCNLTLTDSKGHFQKYGGYVQGQSVISASIEATGQYGAEITYYEIYAGDFSAFTKTAQIPVPEAGDMTVYAISTDSRYSKGRDQEKVTVLSYAAPIVQITSVYRCDQGGNEQPEGEYAYIGVQASISWLKGINAKKLKLRYRPAGFSSWTEADISGSSIIIPAAVDTAYDVQAVCTDDLSTSTSKIRSVPIGFVYLQIDMARKSISIGELVTQDRTFSVALNSVFRGKAQTENLPEAVNDIVNLAYFRNSIRSGSVDLKGLSPMSYRDIDIKFNPPMKQKPRVVCTLNQTTESFGYHFITPVVYSADKNGAKIRVLNASPSDSFFPILNWVAIAEE